MKILTKPIERQLRANALIENETGETQTVALKLFDPYGRFTYYATIIPRREPQTHGTVTHFHRVFLRPARQPLSAPAAAA